MSNTSTSTSTSKQTAPLRLLSTLLIITLAFSFSLATAQTAPLKQWDKRFGGSDNDQLYSLAQTADGGYIQGGRSNSGISGNKTQASQGGLDYWIVKTNANGAKQWDARFGGDKSDYFSSVAQTADGGYILGGWSASEITGDKTQLNEGDVDYWIVKTDANGVKQWDATFGTSNPDFLRSIAQTADGGYILGGDSYSNGNQFWIVKTDANGVEQWNELLDGPGAFNYLYSLAQTADGGYILGGMSYQGSQDGYDYWIVKTDANGVQQWDKQFGGSSDDIFSSIAQTADGGYILGGWSESGISGDKTQASQGGSDYWIVKTDDNGVKQWDATFGGSSGDTLQSIAQTADGGYILGGGSGSGISGDKTQASQGGTDYWIVKTNANGVKQWDERFGGSLTDYLYSLAQTADGGYILGGWSSSGISGDKTQASQGSYDYWMLKLAPDCTPQTFYADADGDGYGNPNITTQACTAPSGYVANNTDCNDGNAAVHPNAADLCNSIDDNCNGQIDENAITATVTPAGTVTVCSGASIILTANTGTGIFYQWIKGSSNIAGATNSTYSTTKAAGYKVKETNSFNCNSTSAVTTVSVASLPTATITPLGNLDICQTGSVVLQANAGSGLTYQWIKGSANVSGATNQNYTATKAATFKVKVTNSSGCSKTSAGTKVTKSCKEGDMVDEAITPQLSIYPNPTNDQFTIDLKMSNPNNNAENETATIEVMNMVGQIIYSEETAINNGELKEEISLDHSMAADGIYLVRVMANDQIYSPQGVIFTGPIVIQK